MDPEEACIQMELLGHDFFVFNNSLTDEVNVVYKRRRKYLRAYRTRILKNQL